MIRPIEPADVEAAVRVFRDSCRASHPFLGESFIRKTEEMMRDRSLVGCYTDVLDDGGIRAFMTRFDSFIDAFFVDPAFQSRGLGKLLLDHAKAAEKLLRLSVFTQNARALRFYQREDFWWLATRTHQETGERIVILEWKKGFAPTFEFEPLQGDHLPMLREWMQRPHVAQWWEAHDPGGNVRGHIVHLHERPIGYIQSYAAMEAGDGWWPDETDPGVLGIDQFIAEERLLDKRIGRMMIRSFTDRLFANPSVTAVQADPDPANERAIRCYRGAGFEDVGVVETPDGPALLMRRPR